MSKILCWSSFALGTAHEKNDVWTRPYFNAYDTTFIAWGLWYPIGRELDSPTLWRWEKYMISLWYDLFLIYDQQRYAYYQHVDIGWMSLYLTRVVLSVIVQRCIYKDHYFSNSTKMYIYYTLYLYLLACNQRLSARISRL